MEQKESALGENKLPYPELCKLFGYSTKQNYAAVFACNAVGFFCVDQEGIPWKFLVFDGEEREVNTKLCMCQ